MSTQYAGGTIINNVLVQSAGTKAEIADWINTQLLAAGWTSVTNSSHNYTLTSATTPQSLNCAVNVNGAPTVASTVGTGLVQAGTTTSGPYSANGTITSMTLSGATVSNWNTGTIFTVSGATGSYTLTGNISSNIITFTPALAGGGSVSNGTSVVITSYESTGAHTTTNAWLGNTYLAGGHSLIGWTFTTTGATGTYTTISQQSTTGQFGFSPALAGGTIVNFSDTITWYPFCTWIKFQNAGGTHIQAGTHNLLPAVNYTWRIIANQYQFFVFRINDRIVATGNYGSFVCGGTPYVPPHLNGVITECVWSHSNGAIDGADSKNTAATFRNRLHCVGWNGTNGQYGAGQYCLLNGTTWEYSTNNMAIYAASLRLASLFSSTMATPVGDLWSDGSHIVVDPLLAWGLTNTSDLAMIRGQVWDGFVDSEAWNCDSCVTYDNANYVFMAITNNNIGNNNDAKGTLFVRIK